MFTVDIKKCLRMQRGYSETGRTDNIMTKRTSHDLQKLHSKLKIEQHEPHKPEVN